MIYLPGDILVDNTTKINLIMILLSTATECDVIYLGLGSIINRDLNISVLDRYYSPYTTIFRGEI